MIDRIIKNEKRLDKLKQLIVELQNSLYDYKVLESEIKLLEKYYGSKNWFIDKELYENGKISNIKAGVLSEDEVWNSLEELDQLMRQMQKISSIYKKKEVLVIFTSFLCTYIHSYYKLYHDLHFYLIYSRITKYGLVKF